MFFYSEATDEPTDPYFSNVSLLIKADGVDGSNIFTDSSNNNFAIARYGNNTKISTANSKYGGSSLFLDGYADYITVANNAAFNFGSGDFTIEMWLDTTTTSPQRQLFAKRANSAQYGILAYITWNSATMTRSVNINIPNATATGWAFGKTVPISSTGWSHFALVRSGNEWSVYANGVKEIINANSSFTLPSNTAPFIFGADQPSSSSTLTYQGYMDDIRITKGVARYTANFTPPDSHPTTGP